MDAGPGALDRLRVDPLVAEVDADGVNTTADAVMDDDQRVRAVQGAAPWGLDRIDQRNLGLSGTYEYVAGGAGVTAYVLDSWRARRPPRLRRPRR